MRQVSGWRLAALFGALALVVTSAASPVLADGGESDGFLLGGTAQHAQDPENPANEVIRIRTDQSPLFGTVSRTLNAKIAALDNMIESKAYFVAPKNCFGGAPRIQLAIDLDGDGQSNGNAHGNYGPLPFGGGCGPSGVWQYQDLTDLAPRWDVTQLLGTGELVLPPGQNPFLVDWPLLETLVSAFQNHRVCTGALVDDNFLGPAPSVMSGTAYYDIISLGTATWEDHDDTAGRGFARGCGPVQGDGDDDDDDHDHDGDTDEDDDDFDENRRDG